MLLKSFFFNLYLLISNISIYLIFFLSIVSCSFLFATLRSKIFLFIICVITFSVWGFLYNLDGLILVLLTAEFTIFLLFLMVYIQLYSNFSFFSKKSNRLFIILITVTLIFASNSTTNSLILVNYYQSITNIVSSDFFILYYLLFDKLPLITVFITLIIGLFSLFFIALYFNLKFIKSSSYNKLKTIYFLRKQSLTKQTAFKSSIYTFQF